MRLRARKNPIRIKYAETVKLFSDICESKCRVHKNAKCCSNSERKGTKGHIYYLPNVCSIFRKIARKRNMWPEYLPSLRWLIGLKTRFPIWFYYAPLKSEQVYYDTFSKFTYHYNGNILWIVYPDKVQH